MSTQAFVGTDTEMALVASLKDIPTMQKLSSELGGCRVFSTSSISKRSETGGETQSQPGFRRISQATQANAAPAPDSVTEVSSDEASQELHVADSLPGNPTSEKLAPDFGVCPTTIFDKSYRYL